MTRVTRSNVNRKRHKKVLKASEGFRGASGVLFRTANQRQLKALQYASRDRFCRKRLFRSLWIARLNGTVRLYGLNYSLFLNLVKKKQLTLNRKILSQLAVYDPFAFSELVKSLQ